MVNEPHGRRSKLHPFGWLKYGNKPCDLRKLNRCQAKAKSKGARCGNPAMKNNRVCWIHGGKSTGPRTLEGLERSRKAPWKHGYYSAESVAIRRHIGKVLRESKERIREINKELGST